MNELLTQMDGVDSEQDVQILVVGTTNRADLLDPALARPGRFDRIVQVDLPDKAGRLHILKIHAANKPLPKTYAWRRLPLKPGLFRCPPGKSPQ